MKKILKSMVDFVLDQERQMEEQDSYEFTFGISSRCFEYAKFLKQPLTLGMFMPCDDNNNVLEEPKCIKECESCDCMYEYDIYQQAKERVIFDGFEVIHKDKIRITIQCGFLQLDYNLIKSCFENHNTIEDLVHYNLELTKPPIY